MRENNPMSPFVSETISTFSLANSAGFCMIVGTSSEVPVYLSMCHVRRQIPLTITWVGVCAAKDSRHDDGVEGAVG